jgi:phosphoribosylformylglycinamidine synthase
VAVGADPARIALLDNFCWGDCERPETLGSLVRAAIACHDMAIALGTPFISGKDSLNNEFTYTDPASGERRTIAIPPTLLISAMGQVEDVSRAKSWAARIGSLLRANLTARCRRSIPSGPRRRLSPCTRRYARGSSALVTT